MKIGERNNMLLLLFCSLLFSGFAVDALSYDYSFTIECLANPHKPQYDGGIVVNPELRNGLKGWTTLGKPRIEKQVSKSGNHFIVARHRQQPHDSFSQKFYLEKQKYYTFSAWLQVSHGNAVIAATFKTPTGFKHAGWVNAQSGCWSMLKGGLMPNASGPAELYFESNNTSVDIRADSISLQPFTKELWRSHQDQSIEMNRKNKVKLHAIDAQGKPLANATVSITQLNSYFRFGNAMNKLILTNIAYQNWFTLRFKVTTFEDEMKWYSTEPSPGREDYSVPDAMLSLAKNHQISVRGHNVFWDDPKYQPSWVKSLSASQLSSAAEKRINSIMKRYSGQVIAWDVVNENLHFSFLESMLGNNASANFYHEAHQIDGATQLFLNEYNTIEDVNDGLSSPDKYLAKIRDIQSGGFVPLAIGLEGHFHTSINLPYMRAAIDKLATAKSPIWITELDVQNGPNQATYLDQLIREAHSHPAVNGIVLWASWKPQGCYQMCLTDNNFKNLPTGAVVDNFLEELSHKGLKGTTNADGYFETSLFHGDYEVKITHSNMVNSSLAHKFNVAPIDSSQPRTLHIKVSS